MNPQPFEIRAFDQLDKRLGDLRSDFGDLRSEFSDLRSEFGALRSEFGDLRGEMTTGFRHLDRKVDTDLRTTIGLLAGQTTVIIGAMAALMLSLHH